MQALEAEADLLIGAWDSVCEVAAGVKCAAERLKPAQLATLYPRLVDRVSATLAQASALPQGRLLGATVQVDTAPLSRLLDDAKRVGVVTIDVPRQLAHSEVS